MSKHNGTVPTRTPDTLPPARSELLARLREARPWDVIIIGGGATGLGCAVDAAARGYRTLLVEAHDFAKGTSSRSTKLIHGGVRYLAQGRLSLVRESLLERRRLLNNAPHLVHSLRFVVPAYTAWERPWFGLGLGAYDLLAGAHGVSHTQWLDAAATRDFLPNLQSRGLKGGIAYFDGQFDDARLAVSLMRTIFDLGGTAINYLPVTRLLQHNGRCAAVRVEDCETHESFDVEGRVIINATGVWADKVRALDDADAAPLLSPSQGIHLVVERDFMSGDSALLVPRTEDGRVLFVIPWQGKVLLGTTDTPRQSYPLEPQPMEGEVDFILRTATRYLTRPPQRADVLSVFAGLRPLIAAPSGVAGANGGSSASSALSREHAIVVSPSGLLTVSGGKWTTYRHMAEQTIDRAETLAGLSGRACSTADLVLHGGSDARPDPWGSDRAAIDSLPGRDRRVHPRLSLSEAEVAYAVRHEMARQIEDVLARRHRALFLDAPAAVEAAPAVARLMAGELGLSGAGSETWQAEQVEAFNTLAERYRLASG
jgi:glycerol-3-phosphate dehydrogenase